MNELPGGKASGEVENASFGDDDAVAVVERDGILMAVGPDRSVQRFMETMDAWESAVSNSMAPAAIRTVSTAAGLVANAQASSGAWVQLTKESTDRFRQLAKTNKPQNGVLSGVIRGEKGRIDQHVKFQLTQPGSVNPLVLTNVAKIATSMAAAAAEEEMRDLIEGIDRKLDALIEDRRSEVVGATRGVTEVMDEAFAHYQYAAELGETAWDKIQTVQPQVLGTWHRGLDLLRTQMDKVADARPTERDDELKRLNEEVLPLWLPVLGQCLVTLTRFRVLEQARVDKVEPHLAESHRELSEQRHHALLEGLKRSVQSLLTGSSDALNVPNRVRVAHPLQVAKMHEAASGIKGQVLDFAGRVDWYLDQSGEWDNKGWRRAVQDLSQAGRSAVEGATSASAEALKRAVQGASTSVSEAARGTTRSVQSTLQARLERLQLPEEDIEVDDGENPHP